MASRILLESLHLEENVFELTEASDMGLLIHFAAPFTGVEISSIPAGIKFAINGPMRDDAFYLHVVNNNDDDKKNIDTLFETLDKVVEDKYPKLFDRLVVYFILQKSK